MIGSHFLDISKFNRQQIQALLDLGAQIQQTPERYASVLSGKVLAMIFEKPSTRTRLSFEIGFQKLGGMVIDLPPSSIGLGSREPIKDVSRVLSRYCDLVMMRALKMETIDQLAEHATVPVINGLSDKLHPCQAVADILTILQHKSASAKIVYIGDGNNVCQSLINISDVLGLNLHVVCPPGYEPALPKSATIGPDIAAVYGADVVYTDVWTSMGQENESATRRANFEGYQVNDVLMNRAKEDVIFMHCLPAIRGEEVSDSVMESANSVVFDQAENRLYAQQAIMMSLLGGQL